MDSSGLLSYLHDRRLCSGGTHRHICVRLSEEHVWVDASSSPQTRVCADSTCLSVAARVQLQLLCIDHLSRDSAAFSSHRHWHRPGLQSVSLTFLWKHNVRLPNTSFPFLPPAALDHDSEDLSMPQVSFYQAFMTQQFCFPACHLFTGNLSPFVQRLSLVCLHCFPQLRRIYSSIFIYVDTNTTHGFERFHFLDRAGWCEITEFLPTQTGLIGDYSATFKIPLQQLCNTFELWI